MEKITHEEFKKQVESIPDNELLKMAHKELSQLCKNGGSSFHMTVPPKVTDTDMIFSEVLRRFEILSFVTEGGVV
jgi:hypothetical protein